MDQPYSVISHGSLSDIYNMAVATPMEGCFVEVGVYRGGSLWHLARAANGRKLYAYDTFTGMPPVMDTEGIDIIIPGHFSDTVLEQVKAAVPEAIYCVGIFPDTLVEMPSISFAHIDCDHYKSIKACIEIFGPKMLPGGIMLFDDYNCVGPGANMAVEEFYPRDTLKVTGSGKFYKQF